MKVKAVQKEIQEDKTTIDDLFVPRKIDTTQEADTIMRHASANWEIVTYRGKKYPRYHISDAGDVYDTYRNCYVSQHESTNGYMGVYLNGDEDGDLHPRVHRLVTEAFLENPNNYPEVDHINGDKHDNRVENLEWVTSKENKRRAIEMGLYKHGSAFKTGADRPNTIATEEQVRQACQLLADGELQVVVAEKTGLTPGMVHSIMGRRSWTHISKDYDMPLCNQTSTRKRNSAYTDEQIKEVCRRLEQGGNQNDIADSMGIDRAVVSQIRLGKLFKRISDRYNINNGKVGNEYQIAEIHRICKMLEQGMTPTEISKNGTAVSLSIINSIKQRRAYTDISSQYNIPDVQDWKRAYREDAVKLLLQGLRYDEILNQLGIQDTRPNRQYLAVLKSCEAKKPENANNPVFKQKTAQIRAPKVYEMQTVEEVCKSIVKGLSNQEIVDKYRVKTDLVEDIRRGVRFKPIFEKYKAS